MNDFVKSCAYVTLHQIGSVSVPKRIIHCQLKGTKRLIPNGSVSLPFQRCTAINRGKLTKDVHQQKRLLPAGLHRDL